MAKREWDFDFEYWNKKMDMEAVAKALNESKSNNDFKKDDRKVPCGVYDSSIIMLKFTKSSTGKPMMQVGFRIEAGAYKGCAVWWNRTFTEQKDCEVIKNFIVELDLFEPEDLIITPNLADMADMIADAWDAIEEEPYKIHYQLTYTESKTGYKFHHVKRLNYEAI